MLSGVIGEQQKQIKGIKENNQKLAENIRKLIK